MEPRSYLYGIFSTLFNIIGNAFSFGNYLSLEGRVQGGWFHNWAGRFKYKPKKFVQPKTETEIVNMVKNSSKIRLFGSGHSFNAGVVSDDTLVSLDKYAGLIKLDKTNNQATFKGGTRMRDVVQELLKEDLAFKALPSHDAQSIGGILSTNVHGTGKDWGFVAETVVKMKIINGNGEVHECFPNDDLFRAAIGGIGAVGIISEVTVKAEPKFNVEQIFELRDRDEVEATLDTLLDKHDHLSLYLFPFAKKCQVSIWDRTTKPQSFLGPFREFNAISFDAMVSAVFGNGMAYNGSLEDNSDWAYSLKQGTNLVMESNRAFNRTIYHLHQELEFTVPYEDTWKYCKRFLELFEKMYTETPKELPYTLLEVRFTPADRDHALIGAGRDRRSTWIDLICNDSKGFEKYYATAEDIIKEIGARPHLGKFCEKLDKQHLHNVHGANFDKFLELIHEHDPNDKFANDFTRRMFRG